MIFLTYLNHAIKMRTVRACRNAIEFNSIPSVRALVPGGYDGLKLDVLLAIPPKYKNSLDLEQVKDVFPYGSIRFQLQDGGKRPETTTSLDKCSFWLHLIVVLFPHLFLNPLISKGMIAPSGIAIDELGDKNDDMVVVCASVTVGY